MLQPKAVVLGTSRADQGIDPSYPGFHFSPVFNLATASQPYKETRRILEMLSDPKYGRLKQAVIGLDFTMSNHLVPFPADYSEDVFSPWYRARLLPSVFTLLDSYRTITQQEAAPFLQANNQLWRKDGFHIVSGTVGKGHALLFDESERHYFRDNYNIPPTCTHDFYPPDVAAPPMDELRNALATAYQRTLDVRLFISPSHARNWEVIAAAGLWSKFEEWKRLLIAINETEAAKAGKPEYPIWDFSGYNSITTEQVPLKGDTTTLMRWYWESSHYKKETGDLVLDRVFGLSISGMPLPDDFGVSIDSRNIDRHLQDIRAGRMRYRATHADEVAEIEAVARQVASKKNCTKRPANTNKPQH